MKKYGFILIVLISSIFTSMISNSAAIYTHSDVFDLSIEFEIPIIKGDFVKYELSGKKICDYDLASIGSPNDSNSSARKCAQGSAIYDEKNNVVELKQDAGFLKYFSEQDNSYLVNGSFKYDNTQMPKNFGMYFNGSFYIGNNQLQSQGYVLQFDKDGNLIINEQGVVNYTDASNHENDSLKTISSPPVRNIKVASQTSINDILKRTDTSSTLDLQVRLSKNDESIMFASVYLNGTLVNKDKIRVGNDLRGHNENGNYDNIFIGASSYGTNSSVVVTRLDIESWDGK